MARDRIAEACFEHLPDHVAVLDDEGTIVRVNHAWRQFGQNNGYADEQHGVGSNYLHICAQAQGPCAAEAERVRRHLADLLQRSEQPAQVVYPCFSPDTPRWFAARMFPLHLDHRRYIAIAHQNITSLVMSRGGVLQ